MFLRLEITSQGIRGLHELSIFGKTIFRKEYFQYRWENTIIFKYFGWPIWGIVVKYRNYFASIGLVNSLYLNDFRTANRAIYVFAKDKAYYIEDETASYLKRLPPLPNEENINETIFNVSVDVPNVTLNHEV